MNMNLNNQFEDIIKHGTYYYPAERHYYAGCVVRCDRCNRTNLKTSIGYHEMDLCLACASQVESTIQRIITPNEPVISPPRRVPINTQDPMIRFNGGIAQAHAQGQILSQRPLESDRSGGIFLPTTNRSIDSEGFLIDDSQNDLHF